MMCVGVEQALNNEGESFQRRIIGVHLVSLPEEYVKIPARLQEQTTRSNDPKPPKDTGESLTRRIWGSSSLLGLGECFQAKFYRNYDLDVRFR